MSFALEIVSSFICFFILRVLKRLQVGRVVAAVEMSVINVSAVSVTLIHTFVYLLNL